MSTMALQKQLAETEQKLKGALATVDEQEAEIQRVYAELQRKEGPVRVSRRDVLELEREVRLLERELDEMSSAYEFERARRREAESKVRELAREIQRLEGEFEEQVKVVEKHLASPPPQPLPASTAAARADRGGLREGPDQALLYSPSAQLELAQFGAEAVQEDLREDLAKSEAALSKSTAECESLRETVTRLQRQLLEGRANKAVRIECVRTGDEDSEVYTKLQALVTEWEYKLEAKNDILRAEHEQTARLGKTLEARDDEINELKRAVDRQESIANGLRQDLESYKNQVMGLSDLLDAERVRYEELSRTTEKLSKSSGASSKRSTTVRGKRG